MNCAKQFNLFDLIYKLIALLMFYQDYVTEKLFEALKQNVVPIVLGE